MRNKDATNGARTLLVAPGLTSNKKLQVTKRSPDPRKSPSVVGDKEARLEREREKVGGCSSNQTKSRFELSP